ncbi:MAG: hypothetical protein U9P80_04445 [Thermodesulfobacteriota bacterium]|nr:hypothetical protein [Thermodesulfobacteriota bacterium]
MTDSDKKSIVYPQKGFWKKIVYLIKYHFHAILFFYVWFGLFVCGMAAPPDRVAELGSGLITQGWHLSVLSMILVLPWPVIYVCRFIYAGRK